MRRTLFVKESCEIGILPGGYRERGDFVLGCPGESEAMQTGYQVLNRHRLDNGRYLLTASKNVPAFKAGKVGEENKWVTLYAYMAQ